MAKQQNNLKRFIVRKYVMAENAQQAINMDKKTKPHDVFVDSDWLNKQDSNNKPIGF